MLRQVSDPRRARWTFFAAAFALAVVLVGATVSSWLGARELSDTVIRGQSGMLLNARRIELDSGPPSPSEDDVAAFVDNHAGDLGLRWVALLGPDGEPVVEAGERHPSPLDIGPRFPDPLRVGEVVRVIRPAGPPGPSPPDALEFLRPGEPSGPPHLVAFEFEPILQQALARRAQRDLAIGIVGALGLLVVAGVVSGWSRRAERAERRVADQRHLASLGEMSAVLAHELRNPLASLKGHAQLLERQLPEGRPKEKASRVVGEAVRMEELVGSLLTFVRSGRIERRAIDPVALTHRVVDRMGDADVTVFSDGAPATWPLDEARMEQVLTNLLENAADASDAGERIEVRIFERARALTIEVRDNGRGIEPEIRDELFTPFKTTKTRGVGLGLAVARRIVESHGGTIEAREAHEGGTIVALTIPEEA